MLSGIAKYLLALTALAPAGVTWALADFSKRGFHLHQVYVLVVAALLIAACLLVLKRARKILTKVSISIQTIKVVDNEVVAYVVTYLFPLLAPATDVKPLSQIFIVLLLALVLATSNAFTFNPILTFAHYHFYEAEATSGVTYLLLSKNDITDVHDVKNVGRLSKHLLVDLT